ncbi:hypothetical protein [Aestuariivirga sp.]|uniref:hypothetical protein n=1 Tax=Aestuariivirga sp. TaxID=2650926 RepID=UPI003918CE4B
MADNKNLGSVPDTSMIVLFKSLVGFLTNEAQGRGWADVTERLHEVESALAVRRPHKRGS